MATPTKKINGEKLHAEIKRRGITLAEASRAIMYNNGMLTKAKNSGTISDRALYALEQKFNITYEDISDPEKDAPLTITFAEDAESNDNAEGLIISHETLDYFAAKLAEELAKRIPTKSGAARIPTKSGAAAKYPQIEFREINAQ